jgi:hypothetical protein
LKSFFFMCCWNPIIPYRHIRLSDKRVHRVGDLSPTASCSSSSSKKVNQFHRIVVTSLAVNSKAALWYLFIF